MNQQQKFNRLLDRAGANGIGIRPNFFERPHWTRRRFFQIAAAGRSGAFLPQARVVGRGWLGLRSDAQEYRSQRDLHPAARRPSQVDTFDFKYINGVTPDSFAPDTLRGVLWPTGLLPKIGAHLPDFAIVRSMRSHALVHTLSQTWTQIGRNPVGGAINAPHIGSVVSIEKEPERTPGQKFPTFLALNSYHAEGPGYLHAKYGPFKVTAAPNGIADAISPVGQTSSFGNACLVAAQAIQARQGTRFIQITSNDGWDKHSGIYQAGGLPTKGPILHNAVGTMLSDLKSSGMLAETLVVMLGEFGRTVGPLTGARWRDHYPQQFAFFAGGGVKGGTIIGATNATGSDVVDYGWSRQRYVYMEDVEATIYSALGIDWTYVRTDDPLHRRFEYVPLSAQDVYGPVHELWG